VLDISALNKVQLANAALIVAAALPFGQDATVAALMCAGDESSWLRYANNGKTTRADVPVKFRQLAATSMQFGHDAVAGEAWTTADSCGLYQQRPMFDYGTIAELMDPAESTRIFIRGSHGGTGKTRAFLDAPKNLTLAQRVQHTQGSEIPTGENYAPFESVARQLLARFAPVTPTAPHTDWMSDSVATREEYKADLAEAMSTLVAKIQATGAPLYKLYQGPDGSILAVHGGGWYHVPDTGVLVLGQQIGLFEKTVLTVDQNAFNWVKGITGSAQEPS
jgi:hypothetical protein